MLGRHGARISEAQSYVVVDGSTAIRQDKRVAIRGIRMPDLTPAQMKVVALVARGRANKAIADNLRISEGTVKAHLLQATSRLELSNRVQLAIWYWRQQSEDLAKLLPSEVEYT